MPAQGVTVEGLDVVVANLARVSSGWGREAPRIHADVGRPLVATARGRARRKTGRMARTVTAVPSRGGVELTAGAGTEYTGVQHYGWAAHGITPNPFLTSTLNDSERDIVADLDRRVSGWVDRVWRDTR